MSSLDILQDLLNMLKYVPYLQTQILYHKVEFLFLNDKEGN